MRVLLIQPPKAETVIGGEDLHLYEPLDLEYLAAGLGERHEPQILDMRFDKDLAGRLAAFAPAVVGLTAYTTHVNVVKGLCRRIKAALPDALVVVGGHHASAFPHDFEVEGIDVVVAGEGVFSFRELVDAFERGRPAVRELLDGQGFPGTRIWRSRHNTTPLDRYPAPRRDLTRDHRKQYFSEWMRPLATVVTSKGCPFRCGFCCLWKLTEGKYLERSAESIVEEIAGLEEENVFFADAESMVNAPRMSRVAQLIKERGIEKKFYCYSRSDTVVKHPELFKQWREVGLDRVFVGFEFFRDGDLDDVHKSSTIEENERAMRTLNALDISMIASFLVRPSFDKEDFRAFREYCQRLKRELKFSMFLFSVLTPLPGTEFYEEAKGQLITHNYDHFDLFHPVLPTKLPMDEFFQELLKLYDTLNGPWEMLPTLLRFKGLEIFRAMQRFGRVAKHMKRAHLDYQLAGTEGANP